MYTYKILMWFCNLFKTRPFITGASLSLHQVKIYSIMYNVYA